jgi:protoporphyrinogen oxidase
VKIGIVGAGMSGLALAERLGSAGHKVTVIEQASQPGGLATYHDHGSFVFDRFYHVILPTDRHLISFIGDIGLADRLSWRKTLTGFFVDRNVYSVSNAFEFLKFPPLSLWGKIRLAFTILYCSRVEDWQRLETITVEDWLIRLSGRATYEKLWKPLLLAKLGENYRRVSAVFIWTYIKRMFSARDTSASKEQMGYVRGGYKTVFDRLESRIRDAGGSINFDMTVRCVRATDRSGLEIETDRGIEQFDKVIFTGPVSILQQVVDTSLVDVECSGENVEYLGVLCMALITKRPLTPFYVLNIADDRIPFTGVIGMSSVVETEDTNGLYLTYLPKYILSTDEELRRPEDELRSEFLQALRLIFPDLPDDQIVGSRIHRAFKVQPLQVLEYSKLIPRQETRHPDFFVLNTAQFVHNTLNNNEVVRAVDEFVEAYGDRLSAPPLVSGESARDNI